MQFAILGFSQTGKSSLYRMLCAPRAGSEGYGVHVGVAQVPDDRLNALAELYQPKKITYATIEFLDSPPLVNDPAKDTAALGRIRNADAFVHVVRGFGESPDPAGDIAALETEFLLVDHDTVTKRLEKIEKDLKKSRSKEHDVEHAVLGKAAEALVAEKPLREFSWSPEEEGVLRGFMLLSAKPLLVVLNAPEEDAPRLDELSAEHNLGKFAGKPSAAITAICGTIEAELAELDEADAAEFLGVYGLKESARGRLVHAAKDLLDLVTVFTAGEREVRSWFVPRQASALEFAELIHSDIAKRFIKAEVVALADLVEHKGMAGAREKGLVRLESKQYRVQEGDVVYIRHSA